MIQAQSKREFISPYVFAGLKNHDNTYNKAQKIIRHINVNIPFMFDCWAYPVVLLLQPTKRLQSLNIPFQQKARSTGFEK